MLFGGFMNKKLIIISILIILVLIIILTTQSDSKNKIDVTLKVKEETITSTGASFIMKNNSDKDTYEYGNPYYLEVKRNNKWEKLETINDMFFTLPAFSLSPKEEKEFDINWEYGYGSLEAGTYRLVKDVFRSGEEPVDESNIIYLFAEFNIK